MRIRLSFLRKVSLVLLPSISVACVATGQIASRGSSPPQKSGSPIQSANSASLQSKSARQRFAFDVVKSAVALPQPDSEDRLRVLASAIQVALPLDTKYARQLAREGMQ